jgi:hypothetical protein
MLYNHQEAHISIRVSTNIDPQTLEVSSSASFPKIQKKEQLTYEAAKIPETIKKI